MARIAIIALMLFAAAPALAQPAETTAPAQADPSKNAPHPNPLPPGGERERTEAPAAPPAAVAATPPPTATGAPPATAASPPAPPPPPAPTGNVDRADSPLPTTPT